MSIQEYDEPQTENSTGADAEMLAAIREANRKVVHAASVMEDLKLQAKNAKKAWELASHELSSLIAGSQESFPLFDRKPEEAQAEPWRSVTLEELGLSAVIQTALRAAGIETLGSLLDYEQKKSFASIQGIGAAKNAAIVDAINNHWEEHPEYEDRDEDEPEDEDD